jgi:hypothetical protein
MCLSPNCPEVFKGRAVLKRVVYELAKNMHANSGASVLRWFQIPKYLLIFMHFISAGCVKSGCKIPPSRIDLTFLRSKKLDVHVESGELNP